MLYFTELLNNVLFPLASMAGALVTLVALTILIAEIATRKPKKHWALLWGPVVFWVALIVVWAAANLLYGSVAP